MATALEEEEGDADAEPPETSGNDYPLSRKRALLWAIPFVALGIIDLVLLLGWGLKPLWGFLIFPPIAFVSVLTYLALRTGLASNRLEE